MDYGFGLAAIIIAFGVAFWFACGGIQIQIHRCNCKNDKCGEE